jgi:hypothetical protein
VLVDTNKIDVTISTIAVVTEPPQQALAIDQKELEQILTRPLSVVQSPVALVVSSQRDQLEAILSGNKTNIRDLSGRKTFSPSKIPTVLNFFIQKFVLQVISYGVNFIVTVPCVQPAQWIANNLISSPQVLKKTGLTPIGRTCVISVRSGRKTWNIKFEPIDDSTLNVDFNASEETQQLPDVNTMHNELQEQFDGLLKFLNDLEL